MRNEVRVGKWQLEIADAVVAIGFCGKPVLFTLLDQNDLRDLREAIDQALGDEEAKPPPSDNLNPLALRGFVQAAHDIEADLAKQRQRIDRIVAVLSALREYLLIEPRSAIQTALSSLLAEEEP